jgi:hypothetical protein
MGWPSAANRRRVSTEGAEKIAAALPHIEDYAQDMRSKLLSEQRIECRPLVSSSEEFHGETM